MPNFQLPRFVDKSVAYVGCPSPLCAGVVNASYVQQQWQPVQRRLKKSKRNGSFPVSCVCSGYDYCRDFRVRIL